MIGINQAALKLIEKEVGSLISGATLNAAEFKTPFTF